MSESANSAAKRSAKSVAEEARKLADQKAPSAQRKEVEDPKFADITKTNPFAQILLNPELSPEHKRDEMTKALTFSKEATKEENRAKLEAFNQFKEYLQEQRKVLNREGIKLQDTEAFAELQSVIDDMSKASIDFQETIKPLIDVLTAVFEIRKHNKITDVYDEIQKDKAWTEEQQGALEEMQHRLIEEREKMIRLQMEVSTLKEDRTLFGFGSVRRSSLERIARIETAEQPALYEAITDLANQLEAQKQRLELGRDSENPELMQQKKVLREFLDLTKDENRHRQKALINAAVNYVNTSDQRLKSVLGTLNRLGKHAEVVADSNGMLRNIHLIMDDSLKSVGADNAGIKAELAAESAGESSIARMGREDQLNQLHEYMSRTDEAAIDIANSIGGLTKHSVQIQAYKDTLRNESGSTKRLHLEGVSQMGEQLMSVLSAISAAATTESRSVAASNFARMAEQNQTIISQEVVKNATNVELEATQIAKLVGELEDYGAVLSASSDIAAQGYGRMRETVDAIRKVSGSVQSAIDDLVSERADARIASGSESEPEAKPEPSDTPGGFVNPFDALRSDS